MTGSDGVPFATVSAIAVISAVGGAVVAVSYASLAGPGSFQECVLDKMKGRPMEMKALVSSVCRTKFPAAVPARFRLLPVTDPAIIACLEDPTAVRCRAAK